MALRISNLEMAAPELDFFKYHHYFCCATNVLTDNESSRWKPVTSLQKASQLSSLMSAFDRPGILSQFEGMKANFVQKPVPVGMF